MRLSYKWILSLQSILLLAVNSYCASYGTPERGVSPLLLANRSDGDLNLRNNEDSPAESDNDQAQAIKRKVEAGKTERDKPDTDSKLDEGNIYRGRPRAGFDNFRNNPLNLGPLNLTAEQKDKIQTMRKESSKKARSIRTSLKAKRAQMCDLMFDPKSTNREILKVRNEARKLHEQADDLMVQDFLAIRELLTPEQKKHLPEIKPPARERNRFDSGGPTNPLPKTPGGPHDHNPG